MRGGEVQGKSKGTAFLHCIDVLMTPLTFICNITWEYNVKTQEEMNMSHVKTP